jgi:5-methyltetrahydrofolate--homocysteine methyltransferase
MQVVGQKFKCNEFYIPEVLIAARAMKMAMEKVKPLIADSGIEPVGRVAIGTVQGDLHDIGKNLVAMMLEGAGFEVKDLGTDVAPQAFVDAVKEHGVQAVALSALLTTTMPAMKETINALKEAGLRDKVKVMVGGAPLTQAYADEIGADGYAPDAASAVDLAKELLHIAA